MGLVFNFVFFQGIIDQSACLCGLIRVYKIFRENTEKFFRVEKDMISVKFHCMSAA